MHACMMYACEHNYSYILALSLSLSLSLSISLSLILFRPICLSFFLFLSLSLSPKLPARARAALKGFVFVGGPRKYLCVIELFLFTYQGLVPLFQWTPCVYISRQHRHPLPGRIPQVEILVSVYIKAGGSCGGGFVYSLRWRMPILLFLRLRREMLRRIAV